MSLKLIQSKQISANLTGSLFGTASYASSVGPLTQNVSIVGNLNVIGTSSFTYSTASIIQVGSNTIVLNTDNPATRFGGITVVDSGSFGNSSTGSIFWDSLNNRWIYSNPSGSSYDGGLLISGPRNTSGLGNEQGTTNNALMKGQGGDHITSSGIFEDASGNVTFGNNSMYISSSGRVGIGTLTPTVTIDAVGNEYKFSSTSGAINFYALPGVNQHFNFINIRQDSDYIFKQNINGAANTSTLILKGSTGNLLINTTTDAGYKLDVNGTARFVSDVTGLSFNATNNGGSYKVSGTNVLDYGNGVRIGYFNGVQKITLYTNAGTPQLTVVNSGSILIGTTTEIASSKLTIESTTKGFLPPRMTTTQKNAIATPAAGLVVYDTTLQSLAQYNGTSWLNINSNLPLQVTPVTLTAASWTLVSGLYEYVYSNVNILSTSVVDVIPSNSTIAIVQAASILPSTESASGSVKLFATNLPTADIIVTFNIFN